MKDMLWLLGLCLYLCSTRRTSSSLCRWASFICPHVPDLPPSFPPAPRLHSSAMVWVKGMELLWKDPAAMLAAQVRSSAPLLIYEFLFPWVQVLARRRETGKSAIWESTWWKIAFSMPRWLWGLGFRHQESCAGHFSLGQENVMFQSVTEEAVPHWEHENWEGKRHSWLQHTAEHRRGAASPADRLEREVRGM